METHKYVIIGGGIAGQRAGDGISWDSKVWI
jgi:succinate dehydrogenase/fumarate reductase flavoprotein subunit